MQSTFAYGAVEQSGNNVNLLHEIYSLRYQVYVNEWEFETAEDHPNGLENDEFDQYSIHYFACDKVECNVIATARIILNSASGFPIEKNFKLDEQLHEVEREKIGEISRLAVSKDYRKRAIDMAIFDTGNYSPDHIPRYIDKGRDVRRHCEHELIRGLYLMIYRDSKQRGLTHWYAVMAKGLYIILKRWGILFKQAGPAKDYHGLRAPYLVSIESIEQTLSIINPQMLEEAQKSVLH